MERFLLPQLSPSAMATKAVVIGVSAGAIEALSTILPRLPANFPVPIVTVVHLPADRKSILAELFQAKCQMKVREVDDKDPLQRGTIYFAPPDYHVLVEDDGRLSLSSEELVYYSRPSIDVLFESAAEVYGASLTAIVMTGASADGANGLAAVHAAGGICLIQNPEQANVRTMPEAALEACPGATVLTLEQIANRLLEIVPNQ